MSSKNNYIIFRKKKKRKIKKISSTIKVKKIKLAVPEKRGSP